MNSYGVNGSGDGGDGDRWNSPGSGRDNFYKNDDNELRRPNRHPNEDLTTNEECEKDAKLQMVKNSLLSPTAEEFFPRAHEASVQSQSSIVHTHSVQDRLIISKTAQNSQSNNMHPSQMMQQNYQHNDHRYNPMMSYNYNEACSNESNLVNQRKNNETPLTDLNVTINQMESSIRVLTMSPGEFDRLVSHLIDIINPFLEKENDLKEIISVIIKQSILEGNFRYNGARLCTHLDTVAMSPNERNITTFRKILLQQCEEENRNIGWQRSPNHTDNDEKRCHGLILFLAELVTQMQSSAPTLGKMLIQLISTVLMNPAPSSTKNICQALKLAGQTLERDNASVRKDMELVMKQLTELVTMGHVDPQISRMVTSVTELRSKSWGRATNNSEEYTPSQNVSTRSHEALDEPVFYGPDGQVISAEESAFLHGFSTLNKEEELNDEYNDVDFLVDREEDEEDNLIAAAYEEFLKLSENGSNEIKN